MLKPENPEKLLFLNYNLRMVILFAPFYNFSYDIFRVVHNSILCFPNT